MRTDYEQLIAEMPGRDEADHVHAAAAVAAAPTILLTANTKDFPAAELGARGVTVRHPDDYFVVLLEAERTRSSRCSPACRATGTIHR